MNELAIFAGGGGGLLGTKLLGWRTVCHVEWEKYAVKILKARIRDGYLDDAPIWDDAFSFDGRPWRGLVDVITAGFPCQPFSVAGKGLAEKDPRNGWPPLIRIIREVRPRLLLLENVPALLSKPYFGTILGELAESGYSVRWDCISAKSVGANHQRDRLWIVAHANSGRPQERWTKSNESVGRCGEERETSKINLSTSPESGDVGNAAIQSIDERSHKSKESGSQTPKPGNTGSENYISNAISDGSEARLSGQNERQGGFAEKPIDGNCRHRGRSRTSWWQVEPELGRVAHGVANRVDRLTAIGNGQVPAVVRAAWMLLGEGE